MSKFIKIKLKRIYANQNPALSWFDSVVLAIEWVCWAIKLRASVSIGTGVWGIIKFVSVTDWIC